MHRAHSICYFNFTSDLSIVSQWNVIFGCIVFILIQTVLNQFNNDVLACLSDEFNHFSYEREELVEEMHCMHAKLNDEHAYQISQTLKLQFQRRDVYRFQPTLRG